MRQRLLDFELRLDLLTSERSDAYDWGRSFLSPGLPEVWDANWVLIERAGMSAAEVVAAADEGLGAFAQRTVAIADEGEGGRLREEMTALGWESELTLYMAWQAETGRTAGHEVGETDFAGCEGLRRRLIRAEFDPAMAKLDETSEQLLESNRRFAAAAGDRWFVAPPHEPASACCLLQGDGIAQIEEVGTLESARGQGLGQAVVLAALSASRQAENSVTFLTADADDWPQRMYEKLGFSSCGELTVLRRRPT
ncbi:MAG TPA: GNAT family N-acetyltransferase [Solirubrobacterales bacterium]|jgi:ribosomal protein S18 acetylase RimI-like enzyme|nr:GNAT family N-acetyltransferase [Solirubrobacterales bacterium]